MNRKGNAVLSSVLYGNESKTGGVQQKIRMGEVGSSRTSMTHSERSKYNFFSATTSDRMTRVKVFVS